MQKKYGTDKKATLLKGDEIKQFLLCRSDWRENQQKIIILRLQQKCN